MCGVTDRVFGLGVRNALIFLLTHDSRLRCVYAHGAQPFETKLHLHAVFARSSHVLGTVPNLTRILLRLSDAPCLPPSRYRTGGLKNQVGIRPCENRTPSRRLRAISPRSLSHLCLSRQRAVRLHNVLWCIASNADPHQYWRFSSDVSNCG